MMLCKIAADKAATGYCFQSGKGPGKLPSGKPTKEHVPTPPMQA